MAVGHWGGAAEGRLLACRMRRQQQQQMAAFSWREGTELYGDAAGAGCLFFIALRAEALASQGQPGRAGRTPAVWAPAASLSAVDSGRDATVRLYSPIGDGSAQHSTVAPAVRPWLRQRQCQCQEWRWEHQRPGVVSMVSSSSTARHLK